MKSAALLAALVLALFLTFGCPIMPAKDVDAIAVWQHQHITGDWDIYYSLWNDTGGRWYTPSGQASAPIAMLDGIDADPDVSSNGTFAVAVWANRRGAEREIYYSTWAGGKWEPPVPIGSPRNSADPTVAVARSGKAIAVWVVNSTALYYSKFTPGEGWSAASRISTGAAAGNVSLPEVAYSWHKPEYYLVFTGGIGTGAAYATGYDGANWAPPLMIYPSGIVDNSDPTSQRTGISASPLREEATAVFPGENGSYSSILFGQAVNFSNRTMPDVAYNSTGFANGLVSSLLDVFLVPDVNARPAAAERRLSGPFGGNGLRPSLAFMHNMSAGIAVWWADADPPGEIYFTRQTSTVWRQAAPLDPSLAGDYDRNPSVAPMDIHSD